MKRAIAALAAALLWLAPLAAEQRGLRAPGASSGVLAAMRGAQPGEGACVSATDVDLWKLRANSQDAAALDRYLKRCPNGIFADLAREQVRRLETRKGLKQRMDTMDGPYRDKGYKLLAHIVSIREGPEDALVGLRAGGGYFRATAKGWTDLSQNDGDAILEGSRDDFGGYIENPLVWLIAKESLTDADYNEHYQALLDNARQALFGKTSGSVIITAYDPGIAARSFEGSDGKLVPALFALYSLGASPRKAIDSAGPGPQSSGGQSSGAPARPPASPATSSARRINVGGTVMAGRLIRKVAPVYPPSAKAARTQGTVLLNAIIAKDGSILSLQAVSGPALLIPAAVEAVKQWVYQPTLLNGEPVEVMTQIDVNFRLEN